MKFTEMNKICASCLVILSGYLSVAGTAYGAVMPRTILALYDSSEEFNPGADDNLIHNNAEMVLNYLGLKLRYHDMASGLPDEKSMSGVYGILSWFTDESMPAAEDYCRWASVQIAKGKRFVILGNPGASRDSSTQRDIPEGTLNILLRELGLAYGGDWTDNPFVIDIDFKDSSMVEFERSLKDEVDIYEKIISLNKDNRVYLRLKRSDIKGSKSDAVVITLNGGFAMSGYVLFIDYNTMQARWRINPFRFFEEAFGLEGQPRFDTTTLFGRRIFYSHIDGDGFRNVSKVKQMYSSGEIIYQDILRVYDLPVTVSFILAEVDPAYWGTEKLKQTARRILALPHVEAGVHAFTHPLDWERQLVSLAVKGYSRRRNFLRDPPMEPDDAYKDALIVTATPQEYLKREIEEPIQYTNKDLLPAGKRVKIYQWSGNCKPPAEAVDMTRQMGVENINGGDTRFDRLVSSYTGVAPLTRPVNGQIQVYTGNANENIYTQGWTPPFDRFRHVIETFRQTETPQYPRQRPLRVSPVNVYYHFYIAERKEGLVSLKEVYDYVLTLKTIPVFTSGYAKIVKGFLSGQITQISGRGWKFTQYGHCRTVRFDRTSFFPDLKRSKGVIGFTRWHDFLYVHLDDSDEAVLYLKKDPPQQPYLREASTVIHDYRSLSGEISFTTYGFHHGSYEFANMTPRRRYEIVLNQIPGKKKARHLVTADSGGILTFQVPVKGDVRVAIK